MSPRPARKDLSLKGLELFQLCARLGSLQATAQETGLSTSTISHHLRSLEDHLNVPLFDHARKPMVLTPKGQVFLRQMDSALATIRKARAEAMADGAADASYLRIGAIEDFESDVMPDLAVQLAQRMPSAAFLYHTASSHEIIRMLGNKKLDLGVTSRLPTTPQDLSERPLLRDPFVLVMPKGEPLRPEDVVAGLSDLPFLHFSSELMIAGQIEAHLRRIGATQPQKFACASNQMLMAMVAANAGWTVTTALLFSRAHDLHDKLAMHPFPTKRFARTLSLVTTPDCPTSVRTQTFALLQTALNTHVIRPMHNMAPWLKDELLALG